MARAKTGTELTPEETAQRERVRVIRRAQEGDESVRPAIQKIIAEFGPTGFHPVKHIARDSLLKAMCGKSILLEEDAKHQMRALHTQLSGENPTPLERLLVERIVVCWLHLHYYETLYAQNMKELNMRQSEYHQRRIDGAHRRYLSAIKALAQVRRLQIPAVQVNIGEKQVNIAGRQ